MFAESKRPERKKCNQNLACILYRRQLKRADKALRLQGVLRGSKQGGDASGFWSFWKLWGPLKGSQAASEVSGGLQDTNGAFGGFLAAVGTSYGLGTSVWIPTLITEEGAHILGGGGGAGPHFYEMNICLLSLGLRVFSISGLAQLEAHKPHASTHA